MIHTKSKDVGKDINKYSKNGSVVFRLTREVTNEWLPHVVNVASDLGMKIQRDVKSQIKRPIFARVRRIYTAGRMEDQ